MANLLFAARESDSLRSENPGMSQPSRELVLRRNGSGQPSDRGLGDPVRSPRHSQGIRANCIMPGLIDTPLIYKQISSEYGSVEDMVTARNAAVPLGRMGTAWDIAHA